MQTENSASPSSGAFRVSEVRMGEVVQLRDYQRKDEPKPETEGELQAQYNIQRSARMQGAPIKDTAPSEMNPYVAPGSDIA